MKKINVTLYDDTDHNGLTYEDYVENCEINNCEPEGDDSDDYYNWLSDMDTDEWECLKDNIKYSKQDGYCVICGTCGLWNGRREIEPVIMDSLFEAIQKCAGTNDYVRVRQVNGHLEVDGIHHDGTNRFEIHLLSKKGMNSGYGADLNKRVYHKAITGHLI